MGLLHLGFLVDFISMPVICGFTNAAAIIISTSQLSTLLGIKGSSDSFGDAVIHIIEHISEINVWDILLGLCSMAVLILLKVTLIKSCLYRYKRLTHTHTFKNTFRSPLFSNYNNC